MTHDDTTTKEPINTPATSSAGPDGPGPAEPIDNAAPEEATSALDEARARAAEMEDRWRRAVAELDNFRKRTTREIDAVREREQAQVSRRWLAVVDNLELALAHAGAGPDPVVEGIRAVWNQALAILAESGYHRHDDVGQRFDPALHEAVATTPDPSVPPGTVVHVVRPRYGDPDRLLRPAAVVVSGGE
jgi:molecular chaperone GrpE